MSPKFKIIISLVSLVIVFELIYFLPINFGKKSLDSYAGQILKTCQDEDFAPTCYDFEIPKLMDILSLEDVFEVTKIIQSKDKRYLYCHVLGHYLSEKEMMKDPSKWKEVLSKAPPTFCNNGFLHGAMIARFNTDVFTDEMLKEVKPDLADVCEDRPDRKFVGVEQSMCYHAVGHLTMYATNANPKMAVEVCEEVSFKEDGRDFLQTCTEGVFMQVFQPLEPEDFALVKDIAPKSKEEVDGFCSNYEGESYDACHRESWPYYREEIMKPGGVEKFCSYTDDSLAERKCIAAEMSMVTVVFISDRNDYDGFDEYCRAIEKEENRSRCYANAATRLIQVDPRYTDDSLKVCSLAKGVGLEWECYRDMAFYGRFSFPKDSKELKSYCFKLPEEWQDKCIDGFSHI